MRTVDEQLERVLGAAVRPAPVRLAITEAYGLRCAEEVVSPRPVPGFDMAAIDGYAVRSVDVFGAGEVVPVELPVVGEIPAGSRHPLRLQPGQAVRVAAGAPLPTLADAVVPVGYTDAGSARVSVTRSVPSAAFVRRLGEDVQPGDIAVRRDAVLGAAQVGLLAAAGRDKVLVHPRPRVSVISVGDELVELARTPGAGQVADICSHALTAAAREAGADTVARGPRPRRRPPDRVGRAGPPAVQRPARRLRGGRRARGRPRCRPRSTGSATWTPPASPCTPARRRGSAGSARTACRRSCSRRTPPPPSCSSRCWCGRCCARSRAAATCSAARVSARLTSPVTSVKGRRGYLRGRLLREKATGDYLVQPLATSGIHLLSALADANCLIVLPEDATDVGLDEPVTVLHLPA